MKTLVHLPLGILEFRIFLVFGPRLDLETDLVERPSIRRCPGTLAKSWGLETDLAKLLARRHLL